ncbi:hypothetical protein BCR44DRAFT_61542 [Catenaria anguillulae PL171]|uniref:Transcriptional adapter 2 n=1 Tax=Catenaria anguillulae PL171 TaxID=765915 RepID=A0A1Y2I2Z7_9FUNG|nr:hypothetical protein BCR44DRAFT_61542 [Catenaria anguillulae PL171]
MTVTHRKQFGARYLCDACRKDVSDIARIACAVCEDFDLCVECFASGVEVAQHKNNHPYRVMETLTFPVYEYSWNAEEELLMMEGFEKYGMGNWSDVAEHIGTKTPAMVEEHYYNVFVNSSRWPLPEDDIEFPREPIPRRRPPALGTSNPLTVDPVKKSKPISSTPCNHDIAGYMPGRGEFDQDYGDNLDEACVKELVFDDKDSEDDKQLKLMIMDIYNDKLDRKAERKRFVFDRGLQEYKTVQAEERKMNAEDKAMLAQHKVFGRFQTPSDFDLLIHGFKVEAELRAKVERLQEYRRAGLTTFDQARLYEDNRPKHKNNKPVTAYMPPPPPLPEIVLRTTPRVPTRRASTLPAAAASADSNGDMSTPDAPSSSSAAGTSASSNPTASSSKPLRRQPRPIDISNADGVEMLDPEERALCSQLRLLPRSYLVFKHKLLAEVQRRNGAPIKRREARQFWAVDVNKTSKIFNFFVDRGWIPDDGRQSTRTRGHEGEA